MTGPTYPPIPTSVTGATLVPAADLRRILDQLTGMADEARKNETTGPEGEEYTEDENGNYAAGLEVAVNLVTVAVHKAAKRAGNLARSDATDESLTARARDFAGNPSDNADAAAALVLRIQRPTR